MSKLLGLAILAFLVYLVLTQGMPWLKTAIGSGAGPDDGGESAYCISRAAAASDSVADELIPHARPPVDPAVWGTALVRVGGELAAAENACSCPTAACGKGSEAIRELRSLFDELDEIARGDPMGFGNPARRMERVYDLLDEARAMARSE